MSDEKPSVAQIVKDIRKAKDLLDMAAWDIQQLKVSLAPGVKQTSRTDVPAAMELNKIRAMHLGLSMTEIARIAGFRPQNIHYWSTGKTQPTLANWERLMITLADLQAGRK